MFGVAVAILPSPDSNKHPFQSKPVLNMEIPFKTMVSGGCLILGGRDS